LVVIASQIVICYFFSGFPGDKATVTVTPTSGLITSEIGGKSNFTVVLDSQPSAIVTIGVSASDVGEGVISVSSLVFGPGNWNKTQTVTVTGVDDVMIDGDVGFSVTFDVAKSSDSNYRGISAANVSVVNTDGELVAVQGHEHLSNSTFHTRSHVYLFVGSLCIPEKGKLVVPFPCLSLDERANVTVAPGSMIVISEGGDTAVLTVVLDSEPSARVTLEVGTSDTSEGRITVSALTFGLDNWSAVQTVTVTGIDDDVVDGDVVLDFMFSAVRSGDSNFNGAFVAGVTISSTDGKMQAVLHCGHLSSQNMEAYTNAVSGPGCLQ
jgi:hypothetical protein